MAEKKKIVKKVISKPISSRPAEIVEQPETESQKEVKSKKTCFFCQNKANPAYTDLVILRRFVTDRAKILPKMRSGVCSRHQRMVAKNVKYARHLALLPFVPEV